MVTKLNIADIKINNDWYPREKWSMDTVKQYADAKAGGAEFPPIVLDRATGNLLDGMHRYQAHKKLATEPNFIDTMNGADPSVFEEIEVVYHDIPEGVPPVLYAAKLSSTHGDRLKSSEKRVIARLLYEKSSVTQQTVADYLGVSLGSVNSYVKDLKAKQDEAERSIIMRLDMLGWTQAEIGLLINQQQHGVSQKLSKISELKNLIKNRIDSGIPHDDVAQQTPMPLQLVWAIANDGKDDATLLDDMGIKVQPYDVWNFPKCHDLFGSQHPGRIPGELIAHVLYFFTQQGDTVIDPMVGSGTTLDVCLTMGRKCYGFDIDTRHGRHDVMVHDIITDGWHERIKKADLIFWDPPYFSKMDSRTIGEDGYIDGSISKLDRGEYLDFFTQRLGEAKSLVKKGTRLAFLMSDWDDNTGQKEGIFVWDYADLMRIAGWTLRRHIQAPLSTQQVHPDIVGKFRASRRLARLERYLLIAEA